MQILNGVFCANVMEKGSIAIDLLSKNKQKNGNYSLICAIALTKFLKKILKYSIFCLQHLSQHEYTPQE